MDYLSELISSTRMLDGVMIALVGALMLKLITWSVQVAADFRYKSQNFSIAGLWVTRFASYVPGKQNIELVRIEQNKESVRLYLEHYSNLNKEIRKFRGRGIFRGQELSSVYYPAAAGILQNGVFVLRTSHSPESGVSLGGIYAEFSHAGNHQGTEIKKADYCLERISISLPHRLMSLLRRSYFKDFDEVNKYLQQNRRTG